MRRSELKELMQRHEELQQELQFLEDDQKAEVCQASAAVFL